LQIGLILAFNFLQKFLLDFLQGCGSSRKKKTAPENPSGFVYSYFALWIHRAVATMEQSQATHLL